MLLLVTNSDDLTADWLVLELQRRQAAFVRFNTDDYPIEATLHWTTTDARLEIGDTLIRASEVSAVWWRRPVPPAMPHTRPPAEAAWASGEALAGLDGFWHAIQAHWVSHPAAIAAADSKLEQLARAQRSGFTVPRSLVTNDPRRARDFVGELPSAVVKSMRSGRVPGDSDGGLLFTSSVTSADLDEAADIFGPEPYFFQETVAKDYELRVTVIGERAFACRIDSTGIADADSDWRQGAIEAIPHSATDLPYELADRCVRLTQSYGLRFSAIDLAFTPDGQHVFFELNANGQWAWVERLTDLPLAARLADELLQT